jgi:hypothetical protein
MSTCRILKIGRDPGNDFVLTHHSISRHHIEVFINEEGLVFITDLQSSNGTFINGMRLKGSAMLQPGDILKLGAERPIRWQEWTKGPIDSIKGQPEQADSILDMPPPSAAANFFKDNLVYIVAVFVVIVLVAIGVLIRVKQGHGFFSHYGPSEHQGRLITTSMIPANTLQPYSCLNYA